MNLEECDERNNLFNNCQHDQIYRNKVGIYDYFQNGYGILNEQISKLWTTIFVFLNRNVKNRR